MKALSPEELALRRELAALFRQAAEEAAASLARERLESRTEQLLNDYKAAKELFESYRDGFIRLENPTPEQALEYRKIEHRWRTATGHVASYMRGIERNKRLKTRQ